jgi:hypothetical protein
VSEANKAVVRRLVAEVFNGGRLEIIDQLYALSWPGRQALDRALPGQLP